MTNKNVEMRQYNPSTASYDTIYPKTKAVNVSADDGATLQDHLQIQKKNTFGTFENAAVHSIVGNGAGSNRTQVIGISSSTDSQLATYVNRDSVAEYISNGSRPPTVTTNNVTYTVNSVTVTDSTDLSSLEVGMIIDTLHTPKYSGIISAINGTSLTVYHWYQQGNTSTGQVPANGFGIHVDPITKIWGSNIELYWNSGNAETAGTGLEIGLNNNMSDGGDKNGVDVISQGNNKPEKAYRARNTASNNSFVYGFIDESSDNAFSSANPNQNGVFLYQSVSGYKVTNEGSANRARFVQSNSTSGGTSINPNNTPLYFVNTTADHTLHDATACLNAMCFIYNITSSPVTLNGAFGSNTSTTLPANSLSILASDGTNWYNS